MSVTSAEFGFYPCKLDLTVGNVTIETLKNFNDAAKRHESWKDIEKGWIYPGLREEISFAGVRELPYSSRILGLPKTHRISVSRAGDEEQLRFIVWCLSFLIGMRLTTTEAGYLDATPIKPGTLVDFTCIPTDITDGLGYAEIFWRQNANSSIQSKRLIAAINSLFIAQYPHHLQFEELMYFYATLDACFALLREKKGVPKKLKHAERIGWMCDIFGMTTPQWACADSKGKSAISALRNDALHEALFVNEPLGFANYGIGSNVNLMLEMRALSCRLLIAILGGGNTNYIKSPVNSRMKERLELGTKVP